MDNGARGMSKKAAEAILRKAPEHICSIGQVRVIVAYNSDLPSLIWRQLPMNTQINKFHRETYIYITTLNVTGS